MKESDLNKVIGDSLDWYYKIPDDGSSIGIGGKRPFDGFGASKGFPVYWEGKYLHKVEAFNFADLKQHQIDNLIALKKEIPYAKCLFIIGIQWAPRELRAYVFENLQEIAKRKEEKQSIYAEEFRELDNYVVKKDGVFRFDF
jgi:penicillin-binding protein-related factor A (putative recombinase)